MLCVQTHTRINLTAALQKGSVIHVGNLNTMGIVISALQRKQNARNVGLCDTTQPVVRLNPVGLNGKGSLRRKAKETRKV
jgi:hypothetical protein